MSLTELARSLRVAIVGAGQRGHEFAGWLSGIEGVRVAAVVEPRDAYRVSLATRHEIAADACFDDFSKLVHALESKSLQLDGVVIATPDRFHADPAIACMRAGLDVLLEKPMAPTLEDCRRIERVQRETGRVLSVCHILRDHVGFGRVLRMVRDGAVGHVTGINLLEGIGLQHFAHAFVRGNWSRQSDASFMLLSKCCHDIDYLCALANRVCRRVSSFGSLSYFNPAHAPVGSARRCVECAIEPTCDFSAIKIYVDTDRTRWPAMIAAPDHSHESHLHAIRTGPYGLCVWQAGNDAADRQSVLLDFDDGLVASFTMTAFTEVCARRLHVQGTLGELWFDEFADPRTIRLTRFDRRGSVISETVPPVSDSHGNADPRIVRRWVDAIRAADPTAVETSATASLASHTVVFAAEQARIEGRVVDLRELADDPLPNR